MHTKHGRIGPRLAVLALVVGLVPASAFADPMTPTPQTPTSLNEFSTSGTIGLTGISGPNVISFNSVADGTFTAPSSFSLGEFLVGALPPGVSTTYTNTPFQLSYSALKVNGETPTSNDTPVIMTGVLNGTV